jgi:hypothetical protein
MNATRVVEQNPAMVEADQKINKLSFDHPVFEFLKISYSHKNKSAP